MGITRIFFTAALILMPANAMAEAIPQETVTDYVNSCATSCSQNGNEAAQCAELCGCVGTKMSAAWSKEDYDRYSAMYEADPNNAEVRGEVDNFVRQCTM